jgi:aminoglycoside phosphotransferase (APT) family kinase protein
MPKNPVPELTQPTVQSLLHAIAPGSTLVSFQLLPGSFSNSTHLVEARLKDGSDLHCVVRRYAVFGSYDRGEKARREYNTFASLHSAGLPAPEPLYLDDQGVLLGTPGIVTRLVPGRLMLEAPADALDWARKLAHTLAQIHKLACDAGLRAGLLDANAEATWFLKTGAPPPYMQSYPGGAELWQRLSELFPRLRPAPSGLVHIDYWAGNLLWHRNRISAVLDWRKPPTATLPSTWPTPA